MFAENLQLAGRCGDPVELTPLDPASDADVALLTKFLELLDAQMVARNLTKLPEFAGLALRRDLSASRLERRDRTGLSHRAGGFPNRDQPGRALRRDL